MYLATADLGDIVLLVLFIGFIIGRLEAWFVLVGVRRHQTLY
jgi:hypothetical protein